MLNFSSDNDSSNLWYVLLQSQIWVRLLEDTGLKTTEMISIIGIVRFCGFSILHRWFPIQHLTLTSNIDNAASVPFGQEPKRVPKVLYDYVSSQGTCVDPYLTVDVQTCSQNDDCHDGNSCTVDTCNGEGECSNQMQGNCCGKSHTVSVKLATVPSASHFDLQ